MSPLVIAGIVTLALTVTGAVVGAVHGWFLFFFLTAKTPGKDVGPGSDVPVRVHDADVL
jgi:hypothetical protein